MRRTFGRWFRRQTITIDTTATTQIPNAISDSHAQPLNATLLGQPIIPATVTVEEPRPREPSSPVAPARTRPVARVYSRPPSPHLSPPPPRKDKKRAVDEDDAGPGTLPTPEEEWNTFGRAAGRRQSDPAVGHAAGVGVKLQRSASLQDDERRRARRRMRQQRAGTMPSAFKARSGSGSATSETMSPSSSSGHEQGHVHERRTSVPFTFGVSGSRAGSEEPGHAPDALQAASTSSPPPRARAHTRLLDLFYAPSESSPVLPQSGSPSSSAAAIEIIPSRPSTAVNNRRPLLPTVPATTTTDGQSLAPRPPSPAHSTASRGSSRFHEILDDDRASVVPPSPPESSSTHQQRTPEVVFFGGGDRSVDGLRLQARRFRASTHTGSPDRTTPTRSRTRVLSVERPSFEVSVTPPTPMASSLGIGLGHAREMSKSEGKRKASDPDSVDSEHTFARRAYTKSTGGSSATPSTAAPSAYRNPKRIRLSTPPSTEPAPSAHQHPPRPTSRASTTYSARTGRSSIPVRAIVSPRPASVAGSHRTFHMRDPVLRPPPPVGWRPRPLSTITEHAVTATTATPWTAWAFYIGFILFPLWWLAALSPVAPWPEREKPDWNAWVRARDERAWRRRCRWMSGVGLLLYVPLIILAAVFGRHATTASS